MRHLVSVSLGLLLTAGACSAQETGRPAPAAGNERASVCLRGVDVPELTLVEGLPEPVAPPIRRAPPREQVDSIPWQGKLFVPYGGSRSIHESLRRIYLDRVVRAGFIHGAAFYADPARIHDPEFLHLLDERDCTVQTYQEVSCTLPLVPAIVVHARDADGGRVRTRLSASFRDGDYVTKTDSAEATWTAAQVRNNRSIYLYEDRAGTYEIEVRADGYATWRVGGVVVHPGRCRVQQVTLRAYLQPVR